MIKKKVGTDVVFDVRSGKHFSLNQNTGETKRCTVKGGPLPKWEAYVSGCDASDRAPPPPLPVKLPKYIGIPKKCVFYGYCPRPALSKTSVAGVPDWLVRKERAKLPLVSKDLVGPDVEHIPKKSRDEKRTRSTPDYFKQTHQVEGSPFKATITAQKAPGEVRQEEVIEFVVKLAKSLVR